MKIVIGADPFAVTLKDGVKKHLEEKGHTVIDVGSSGGQEVAYYDVAQRAARAIQEKKAERGILFCGTGAGVAIVAGKHRGIVAVCVESVFAARMCRSVNNANVLCMGAMIWGEWMANEAVDAFLGTQHAEGLPELKEMLFAAVKEVAKIDEGTRK